MTPEFSLRENSDVVPPAERAESRIALLFLVVFVLFLNLVNS